MKTDPEVGLSSPPIALKSVDFPDPEGPIIEMYSPRIMSRSTPLSARRVSSPIVNSLIRPLVRTTYSFEAIFSQPFPYLISRRAEPRQAAYAPHSPQAGS